MHARVSTYSGEADALREGLDSQSDALQQLDGFQGAYLLVDGENRRGITITLWESEAALQESSERANQMREAATEPSGASIESVDSYEVALTVGL
jgi:heme-degrading monooxygenase HmoA